MSQRGDQRTAAADGEPENATFEQLVEGMIESQMAEVESELDDLRERVEEIDNFARISLNERKIKQSEANLSEFSDSLTGFAEKAFDDINELEERLDVQALLLASILDALAEEGTEPDLSAVERQRRENVVATATPDQRLDEAVDRF